MQIVYRSSHLLVRGRRSPVQRLSVRPAALNLPRGVDIGTIIGIDSAPEVDVEHLRDVKAVSYVSRRRLDDEDFDPDAVDDEGLPLVYNEEKIAKFWATRPGELAGRWTKFAAVSVPWLSKLVNAFLSGQLEARQADLARDAVDNLEQLGPTFLKLAQILSIRPDVLPPPVMAELARVQDKLAPFSTEEARRVVEHDLGAPIDELFSEFGAEPVGAASLAQVYRARLRSTGQEVAVKVQRPGALATISKDMYVMRRAVGVYEKLIRRFTAQTTDYKQLLSTFAEGLYTELDFRNEALNAARMKVLLEESDSGAADRLVIPMPMLDLTTRRVLTMEWVTGVKLTTLPPDEIRTLVGIGQEAFLTQLLQIGFIHGDPHPGNLLKVTEGPDAGKLALLDFGLVAEVPEVDRAAMVSAIIHLANRDWDALIDDFIVLEFLPEGSDRALIVPVMERVMGPYLRGGGAKYYNFQALTQDLLAATMEIPFSVPPYMSLLARAIATLEGIALLGDPHYQMVAQAYPFVARRVLCDDGAAGDVGLLRDMLYDSQGQIRPARLSALLQAALGYVAAKTDGFVDLDALPEEGANMQEVLRFVLSPQAKDLRPLLVSWLSSGVDLLLRDRARKAVALAPALVPRIPFVGALPVPPAPPVYVPGVGFMPLQRAVDTLAPPLDQQESVYLASLIELAAGALGVPAAQLASPDASLLLGLLTNPGDQARELAAALGGVAGDPGSFSAATSVAADVAAEVARKLAGRAEVPVDTMFPILAPVLGRVRSGTAPAALAPVPAPGAGHASAGGNADSSAEAAGARRAAAAPAPESAREPARELAAAAAPAQQAQSRAARAERSVVASWAATAMGNSGNSNGNGNGASRNGNGSGRTYSGSGMGRSGTGSSGIGAATSPSSSRGLGAASPSSNGNGIGRVSSNGGGGGDWTSGGVPMRTLKPAEERKAAPTRR